MHAYGFKQQGVGGRVLQVYQWQIYNYEGDIKVIFFNDSSIQAYRLGKALSVHAYDKG